MAFPTSNLPTAALPWGREVEKQLSAATITIASNELNNAARDNQLLSTLTRVNKAAFDAADAAAKAQAAIDGLGSLDSSTSTYKLSASNLIVGTLDASVVTVTNLNAGSITTGSLSGDRITGGTITGSTISGGSLSTTGSTNISVSGTNISFNYNGNPAGSIYGSVRTGSGGSTVGIVFSASLTAVMGELGVYDSVFNLSNTSVYSANAGRTIIAQGGTMYPTTTTATSTAVHQSASGAQLTRSTSSRRYKLFEEEINTGLGILNLVPKTWIDKNEYEENNESIDGLNRYVGFIAEDLDAAGFELFVYHNPDGSAESIDYGRLVAAIVPVLKSQQQKIEQLEAEVSNLKGA